VAHQKSQEIASSRDREFGVVFGKPSIDKVLPAMPIRVIYHPVEHHVSMELKGKEHIFRIRILEEFTPHSYFYPWDAYGLRDLFEGIKSPEEAFRFLNVAGRFWEPRFPSEETALTWSEFRRWQSLIRRLRSRRPSEGFPRLGIYGQECRDLFLRSEFLSGESTEVIEQIWNVSEDTFSWLQGFPTGLCIRRDMYLSYEETKAIFSAPGADIPDSKAWHDAQAILARRRAKRAAGNTEEKQKLLAEVFTGTALDAILATIYIDNLRGVETEVCALNGCEQTFEVRRGKEYCCNYHAHLASIRRNRLNPKAKKKPARKKGKAQ